MAHMFGGKYKHSSNTSLDDLFYAAVMNKNRKVKWALIDRGPGLWREWNKNFKCTIERGLAAAHQQQWA